jgi:hypothetical protein
MAPTGPAVAYVGVGKDDRGDFRTLNVWSGGAPRELLKVRPPEIFALVGWSRDGLNLLVIRWSNPTDPKSPTQSRSRALWRIPVEGSPVFLNLAMESLRDASLHPDGRHIAFNAGYQRSEFWVMENFLAVKNASKP